MEFREIRRPLLQSVIDSYNHQSISSTHNIKKLFNKLYKLAIENDIVSTNYAANLRVGGRQTERGVPFTEDEIKRLWDNSTDRDTQIILIMIYTGYRIGELEVATLDREENCFRGGLKTAQGVQRAVPIHPAIRDFVYSIDLSDFNAEKFRSRRFYPKMEELGMTHAASGENHTPHDCRHTFSWLADTYGMDETAKRMVLGHVLGNDVDSTVYRHRTLEQLSEEIKKIRLPEGVGERKI